MPLGSRARFAATATALLALLAVAVAPALSTDAVVGPVGAHQALREGVAEQEELSAPFDAMLARQLSGADPATVPTDVLHVAAQQAAAIGEETAAEAPQIGGARWELEGPTNIGGRVLDIAVDPELEDTIYVAAASGGVWRSTDAGDTFEPRWPADLTQAIGALTVGEDGTLWAGTGETGPGGGSLSYGGYGVYKSVDRGLTWQHVGLEETSRIGRVVVHPDDPQTVYVAASGPLFSPDTTHARRGLYRTTDGGATWELLLRGANGTTGAADVAVNPDDPDHILVAMWDHLRTPDQRLYGGVGSGLFVTRDGGETWDRVAPGVLGPRPDLGRIGVAFAPSNPDVVYVTASGPSGAYAGAFKSTDGGTTFTPIAHPLVAANNVVYGWWFGRIYVDPQNANRVWHLGLNLIFSNDGGVNFTTSGGVHADQHGMAWDPKVEDRVYLGNDGGVYRSDVNGGQWQFGTYQPFSQLYGLDIGQQDPRRQVAGLQDNGVNRSYDNDGEVPGDGSGWNGIVGGDGERSTISPANQQIVYGCSQYGACSRSTTGGRPMSSFSNEVVSSRKNWFTPIELDPFAPSTAYTGGELMSVSHNDGADWAVVSTQDFSNGPGRETNPLFINYGTLTTIAPAGDTIYAGTDDGNLWYSHDAGATWTQATDPDLPTAWVTRVEVDPLHPDEAYVTYSGFRQGGDSPYVLRTTDGGRHWSDITGNLPQAPLNDVNVIGDDLVVASDVGVFLSRDGGGRWFRVGSNLPRAPVHELRWHEPTQTLYVATFGRGLWSVSLPFLSNASSHTGTWLGPVDEVPAAAGAAGAVLPVPLG